MAACQPCLRDKRETLAVSRFLKHHCISAEHLFPVANIASALMSLYAPALIIVVSSPIHLHFSATTRGSTHEPSTPPSLKAASDVRPAGRYRDRHALFNHQGSKTGTSIGRQ